MAFLHICLAEHHFGSSHYKRKQAVFLRTLRHFVITGRNEVVAKVMFLHVSVILFTGGVSGEPPPPRPRRTPPGPGRPPRDQADPPGPRRTPRQGEPPPPGTWQIPPGAKENPPGKKTAAYVQ